MTAPQLRELLNECENISLTNPVVALSELRSVLTALIEHAYFRQQDLERYRK